MKQTDQELWAVAAEYYKLKSEGKTVIAQYYDPNNNIWYDYNDLGSPGTPYFDDGEIWRLKSETVQHRGGKYPKPCTDVDELIKAEVVYKPSYHIGGDGQIKPSYIVVTNVDNFSECQRNGIAKSGLYYLNRDDAIARAKVIYEID